MLRREVRGDRFIAESFEIHNRWIFEHVRGINGSRFASRIRDYEFASGKKETWKHVGRNIFFYTLILPVETLHFSNLIEHAGVKGGVKFV